jgi:hypothetical protein
MQNPEIGFEKRFPAKKDFPSAQNRFNTPSGENNFVS